MHVLPRVRELHERFPDVLTVVGVHAGKFSTERHTQRIAEACDRLGVLHPVVNDRQFRVWHDYGVRAWPTVAVIDPEGHVARVAAGEFALEPMIAEVERIAERARHRGTLSPGPDPFPATIARHEGPLRFPTRAVVVDSRLWISDTGHGRVLECEWDARARTARLLAEYAGLEEPRGLAAVGGATYVADRGGHAIWRLARGERERVAGTGRIGESFIEPGAALAADLRSPWGLAALGNRLAVAMAGTHQLWSLDPGSGSLELQAGTGAEALVDGAPFSAALAQPTGVASLGDRELAVADCESSAVRVVGPDRARTLVGTGLFDFGDRDGTGDEALLQHCEDVAHVAGALAVADTYIPGSLSDKKESAEARWLHKRWFLQCRPVG